MYVFSANITSTPSHDQNYTQFERMHTNKAEIL